MPATPKKTTKNPALPKRVLLRGFDSEGRAGACEWLKEHQIEVINMPSLAEMVVAGPESEPALLDKARVKGARVIAWEEFCAQIKAANGTGRAGETCRQLAADALSDEKTDEAAGSRSLDPVVESKAAAPIENTGEHFRILDLRIPLPRQPHPDSDRVPDAAQFAHLCMDRAFLETLRAVALGVMYGMPVALEGETAASKTSAILYLAHLLGQPVVRLNLSGHTDAAELVGRYVPADINSAVDWPRLNSRTAWLGEESRKIFTAAESEGRILSEVEKMSVVGREKIAMGTWRFQEGYLPQAMRRGWWLLLDEMNLAETQVLERLNCALENPPGLVLTEGDGAVFGKGGSVQIHTAFRMLATMNPSEYAGRAVLSQAFADRWGVWHQAAGPGEKEIEQMLLFLVFGEHPRVLIGGRAYRAAQGTPVFSELQSLPKARPLLQRLAVFHHGIFRAAGGGGATPSIGRLNKERYSFSRRILLNLLRYVAERIRAGAPAEDVLIPEAIQALYLARVRDDADRKAVNNILRAGGLL
jgi:MoxR-like ATPase